MTDFEQFLESKGEAARDTANEVPTLHAWGNNNGGNGGRHNKGSAPAEC